MKNWQAFLVITIFLALLALAAWQWGDYLVTLLDQNGERFQSLDSLVALVSAFFSLISGIFTLLIWRGQKTAPTSPAPTITKTKINTGGGAYVGGNVDTGGGDFVGRDKKKN